MKKQATPQPITISPKRLRIFKIMAIGFGLFMALLLSEVIARVNYFGADAFSYTKVNSFIPIGVSGFLTEAEDHKVLYELKPNIDAYFKLKKFKTNSQGSRDKEYDISKPANTIRGLVIGDSFTMASGVEIKDAYHSVVEQTLNEGSEDINYELINFGVGGYNLLNYLGLLEDKVMRYDPDFIIIGYCAFNDYFLPSKKHYEGDFSIKIKEKGKKPFYSFYLGGLIERTFASAENSTQMFDMQPEQSAFIAEMFEQFSAFTKNKNIPILIAVLSVLPDNGNMAIVEEIANRNNLPITNSFGEIPIEELSSFTISKLDHHPNAKAHKVYAQNLLEFDKFQEVIEEQRKKLIGAGNKETTRTKQ